MKKDFNMLTGKPFSSLLIFALPMVIGNLLQQLYNVVDSIIVGKVAGQEALNAVGASSTILNIYIGIAIGLSVGCSIVFSQLLGAGHIGRLKTAFYTAIITFAALSFIAIAGGLIASDAVLHATNVPETFYDEAKIYYQIYIIGFPAMFIYNIANSGFNSLGKSRITLYLLAGASITNVFLDIWFVQGMGMGVAGAAIATDISQYLAAIVAIVLLLRELKTKYVTEEHYAVYEFRILINMLKIAIPTMLAQIVVSVGYTVLMSLVNTFNNDIIAGYVAGMKLDSLCAVPMTQFGNAVATFTGQNVGARQYDRVPKGILSAGIMCAIVWALFVGAVQLFGHDMIGWFMKEGVSEAAYTAGVQYMTVMSSFYIVLGLMYVFAATLRGAGDAIVSVIGVTINFASRCIFAYVMVALMGGPAVSGTELYIWWSNPIGWFVALIICSVRFSTGKWKTKRVADKV